MRGFFSLPGAMGGSFDGRRRFFQFVEKVFKADVSFFARR